MQVKPKKFLGQHFLRDSNVAVKIVDSLIFHGGYETLLEVGPGTGVLTDILFSRYPEKTVVIDVDPESIRFLRHKYPGETARIIQGDFLNVNLDDRFGNRIGIIGNFPYNISSQIFFKVLNNRDRVNEVVCMVQKEVAERIASGPGNKIYGILSVLIGAFYRVEYLFSVPPTVFHPMPKVHSAVIRLCRNEREQLPGSEEVFWKIVKQGFQNRRKKLRNALKSLNLPEQILEFRLLDRRAEQLSVEEFIDLSFKIDTLWKK